MAAESHGIFDSPDVILCHDLCISSEFADETAYAMGVQALLHACDLAYSDKMNKGNRFEVLRGVAFCLADVHFKTGYFFYCLNELKFIKKDIEISGEDSLQFYINTAIEHQYTRMSPDYCYADMPVATEILSE